MGDRRPGLGLRDRVGGGALQHGLGEFEMPVAEHAPDEPVGRIGGVVEAIGLDRAGRFRRSRSGLAQDPAVERFAHARRIEALDPEAAVDLGEARGVPELGREVAVALDPRFAELDVPALRRHRGKREPQRIGAEAVDEVERVDDVALRLRHLRPLLVAHEGVDVDVAEGDLRHEMKPHHHHPRDPEEDDVEAGDQRVGRIEAPELRRLLRPAERREGPQSRGEPGVEHVLVAGERLGQARGIACERVRFGLGQGAALDAVGQRRGKGRVLGLLDKDRAPGRIPGRNLVAPPELARNAPGLDVLEPVEIGLLPGLRRRTGSCPRARPRSRAPRGSWRRRTTGR